MGNSPVDRNKNYMQEVWGTTSLTTDYWSLPKKTNDPEERVLHVTILRFIGINIQ